MKSHFLCSFLGAVLLSFTGCATQQRISIHCAQSNAVLEQAQPLTYALDFKSEGNHGLNRAEAERYVRQALALRGFEESIAAAAHFRVEVNCEVDSDDSAHKVEHRVELSVRRDGLLNEGSAKKLRTVKERVVDKRSRQVIRMVVRDLQQKPSVVVWHVKTHTTLSDGTISDQLVPGLVWVAVQELGRPEGSHQVVIDIDDLKPLLQPIR